jgi:hypothetical protein
MCYQGAGFNYCDVRPSSLILLQNNSVKFPPSGQKPHAAQIAHYSLSSIEQKQTNILNRSRNYSSRMRAVRRMGLSWNPSSRNVHGYMANSTWNNTLNLDLILP